MQCLHVKIYCRVLFFWLRELFLRSDCIEKRRRENLIIHAPKMFRTSQNMSACSMCRACSFMAETTKSPFWANRFECSNSHLSVQLKFVHNTPTSNSPYQTQNQTSARFQCEKSKAQRKRWKKKHTHTLLVGNDGRELTWHTRHQTFTVLCTTMDRQKSEQRT